MTHLLLLAIGLSAGVLSGMFGIGGGLIIVPALIFLVGMKEYQALGTSLAALVPPVGILGAFEYWQKGYVNVHYAAFIAVGLLVGAYFGARITLGLHPALMHRLYGGLLLLVAGRMLLFGK